VNKCDVGTFMWQATYEGTEDQIIDYMLFAETSLENLLLDIKRYLELILIENLKVADLDAYALMEHFQRRVLVTFRSRAI